MSAVILRRITRFLRSLPLAALAVFEFKLEAVKVGDRQGYITHNLLAFLVNHLPHFTATYTPDSLGFPAALKTHSRWAGPH